MGDPKPESEKRERQPAAANWPAVLVLIAFVAGVVFNGIFACQRDPLKLCIVAASDLKAGTQLQDGGLRLAVRRVGSDDILRYAYQATNRFLRADIIAGRPLVKSTLSSRPPGVAAVGLPVTVGGNYAAAAKPGEFVAFIRNATNGVVSVPEGVRKAGAKAGGYRLLRIVSPSAKKGDAIYWIDAQPISERGLTNLMVGSWVPLVVGR